MVNLDIDLDAVEQGGGKLHHDTYPTKAANINSPSAIAAAASPTNDSQHGSSVVYRLGRGLLLRMVRGVADRTALRNALSFMVISSNKKARLLGGQ
jgi:hypothetical protein